jgi:prepilin-type N-terminal cleavage/methylation domain-containing protein
MKKGFTLIEMLVVVTMIGILATIVILNVASARGKANNANTLATMNTIQKVAAQCLYADFYLRPSSSGVLNNTVGLTICLDPSIEGTRPDISMKSSNGRRWNPSTYSYGPTDNASKNTPLEIKALTNNLAGGNVNKDDFRIYCTLTGCIKEQSTSVDNTLENSVAWTSTVTW